MPLCLSAQEYQELPDSLPNVLSGHRYTFETKSEGGKDGSVYTTFYYSIHGASGKNCGSAMEGGSTIEEDTKKKLYWGDYYLILAINVREGQTVRFSFGIQNVSGKNEDDSLIVNAYAGKRLARQSFKNKSGYPSVDFSYTFKKGSTTKIQLYGGGDLGEGLNAQLVQPLHLYIVAQFLPDGVEDPLAKLAEQDSLENDSVHVVIDDDASGVGGEWKWAIPASVLAALLGFLATKGSGKGKGSGPQDKNPCQMRIYKDFGDTLLAGDQPKIIFARIVRIPPGGGEYTDPMLTQMLQITPGDQYMQVRPAGMHGEWMSAWIAAPQLPEGMPLPEEGVVSFFVGNEVGSFTNRLHFTISPGEIRFRQDNLTLPARYEKEVKLPFIVVGMNDGTAILKATVTDDKGKEGDYTIRTEWDAKKQCYHAVIRDTVTDPKKDEGIAGNYLGYTINIEASKSGSRRVIKGSLPLYRYYMGLVMRMTGNIHCYLEEYNPMHHDSDSDLRVRMEDGKEYTPAQQECFLKLYDYNEEKHELYVIDPKPKSVRWTVKEIADGGAQKILSDLMGNETLQMGLQGALAATGMGSVATLVSKAHEEVLGERELKLQLQHQRLMDFQKQLDSLGLQFTARWQTAGEGYIYYVLRCAKSVLVAPNRFDAEMEITAEHKGKTYSFKRMVHLLSQPKREFDNLADEQAALQRDDEITDRLYEIEGGVMAAGLNKQMAPMLYFVRLQLDFYHADYGYDPKNIKAIKECYQHAMQRKAGEDSAEAAEANRIDNLKWYNLEWWLQRSYEGHDLLHSMHWTARVGFAVASFGYTELVFNIPYEMRKHVMEGDGTENVLSTFKVGALEAVEAYALEMLVGGAIGAGKALGKAGWQATKIGAKGGMQALKAGAKTSLKAGGQVLKESMGESVRALGNTLKAEVNTGLKTWAKKQVWMDTKIGQACAAKAKALIDSLKGSAGKAKWNAAEKMAEKMAMENIEHLQTALELVKFGGHTAENLRLRDYYIMKCHADKIAMKFLKDDKLLKGNPLLKGVDFNIMRGRMNKVLWDIYQATDQRVIEALAKDVGISANMIKVQNASSSKIGQLMTGNTVTFDRDITYYYMKDGVPQYFDQRFTEQLYAKHFREVVNARILPPGAAFNSKLATPESLKELAKHEARLAEEAKRLYDQTVIEDILNHPESYGDDLGRMIDPLLHPEDLKNPAKVAEAVLHKGVSRFDYADVLWAQGETTRGILKKQIFQARSVSEMMEGCRQMVKVFDLVSSRDAVRHLFSKIPNNLREAIEVLRLMDGANVRLSEVEMALTKLGFSFRSLAKEVSETVLKVG